jgi:hypothetical protein
VLHRATAEGNRRILADGGDEDDEFSTNTAKFFQLCDALVTSSSNPNTFAMLQAVTRLNEFVSNQPFNVLEVTSAFEPVRECLLRAVCPNQPNAELRVMACTLIQCLCLESDPLAWSFTPFLPVFVGGAQLPDDHFVALCLKIIASVLALSAVELRDAVMVDLPIAMLCEISAKQSAAGKAAVCLLLAQYARFPLPSLDDCLPVISEIATHYLNDHGLTAILEFLYNASEWSSLRLYADHLTVFPQFLTAEPTHACYAYRILWRAFVRDKVTFGVTIEQILGVALDDRRDKEVRLSASNAAHQMVKTSHGLQVQIFTSGLYQRMLAALGDLPLNLRFHIGMAILAIASICDETTYGSYLEPGGSTTFYDATCILYEMEHVEIWNGLFDAWDILFSLGGDRVIDEFLALFPGESIWSVFSNDDPNVEPNAAAFLAKWFCESLE